jgi:hypothetical protein
MNLQHLMKLGTAKIKSTASFGEKPSTRNLAK